MNLSAKPIAIFSKELPMQLKLITVRYDPSIGSFPVNPLADIEGEVISAVEHFFEQGGLPHLLLVVHYRAIRPLREAAPSAAVMSRPAEVVVHAQLSVSEQELFDRLRAWRNSRAQADGVPPYVLLTNRQVAAVARRRPGTLTALREVEGIGEAKAGRFGSEVLAVVAHPAAPLASSEQTDASSAA